MNTASAEKHTEIVNLLQEHQKNQKVECSKDADINLLKKEIESLKLNSIKFKKLFNKYNKECLLLIMFQ